MNEFKQQLYFFACVPPPDISNSITGLKEEVAANFGSRYALRSPPHITLFPPFKYPEPAENQLVNEIAGFAHHFEPFYLTLNGYGAFPARVIFIKPEPNPALNKLHQELLDFMERLPSLQNQDLIKEKSRTYRPHLTIAHRDLKVSQFHKAWPYFQNQDFVQSFLVDSITLLKYRTGGWDVHRKISLQLK